MAGVKSSKGVRTQGSRIRDICHSWQEESYDWDTDCVLVSDYYSGKIAETPDDQDVLGLVDHGNFMIGRKGLIQAREETLAAFLKPRELINFKLLDHDGTEVEKAYQAGVLTKVIDDHIRKEDPMFMAEVEENIDRQIAHGDALMMFPPRGEGWRPYAGKILTDADAPQNPSDDGFNRWAIYGDLQIGDALSAISNGQAYWEDTAEKFIRDLWKRRYDIADNKKPEDEGAYVSTFDSALNLVESISPVEWQDHGTLGLNLTEFYNTRFRVFYYFQKDFTEADKTPVDMYIVARVQPRSRAEDDATYEGDPLLYAHKGAYPSVESCIVSFVLDSNIGVDSPSWNTIKGLGHVNYQADRWTNLLLSSMVNSAVDKNTPLLEVADHADVKMLEKFVKDGYRANSIIPAGANYVDKSKQGVQVGEALNMLGFLQNQANANAISSTGVSEGQSGELRVQALNRQQNDSRTASNRGELLSRRIRAICVEVAHRIIDELQSPSFTGREGASIDRLRDKLKEAKIDMAWVTNKNVVADYSRLVGDGDPQVRRQISAELIQNIGLIPAEKRSGVLQEWYAGITGDWQKAVELYAEEESPSPDQQALALDKASAMMVTGVAYPVTKRDVPETQLPLLLQVGQSQVDAAVQIGQFESQQQIDGLTAIGQHSVLLAQVLEQRGQRDLAKTFMNEIQRLSTEAQEPINNFLQAQEAKQDPKLEMQQAELQLKAAREDREERTFGHKQQKDAAQIQGKQRQDGVNEVLNTRRLLVEEDRIALEKQKAQQKAFEDQSKRQQQSGPS